MKKRSLKLAKFPEEVLEIFDQLKSSDIKLSMIKEATLINKLTAKHHIKPTVIQKQIKMSLPHIYNLKHLAALSPKMKAYVISGKIKGTDALSILRQTNNESEFLKMAEELTTSKIDHRKKENRTLPTIEDQTQKKERIKKLVYGFVNLKSPEKSKKANELVEALVDI